MSKFICPKCSKEIYANGVGAKGSPKLNFALRTIFFASCKLFHEPSISHDRAYHIYNYGKDKADAVFLADMLKAIEEAKCNWFSEKWYRFTADQFHFAVQAGGHYAYCAAQLECLLQMNLNSRSIR